MNIEDTKALLMEHVENYVMDMEEHEDPEVADRTDGAGREQDFILYMQHTTTGEQGTMDGPEEIKEPEAMLLGFVKNYLEYLGSITDPNMDEITMKERSMDFIKFISDTISIEPVMNKLTKNQWNRAEALLRNVLHNDEVDIIDIQPNERLKDHMVMYLFQIADYPFTGTMGIDISTHKEAVEG